MAYQSFYPNGWRSGEVGGTPITPEALNHMEEGIADANSIPTGITLSSTDNTMAAIYARLNVMRTSQALPIHVHANAATVLTNGKLTGNLAGVVERATTNNFMFLLYPLIANISAIYTFRATELSASGINVGNIFRYSGTVM